MKIVVHSERYEWRIEAEKPDIIKIFKSQDELLTVHPDEMRELKFAIEKILIYLNRNTQHPDELDRQKWQDLSQPKEPSWTTNS